MSEHDDFRDMLPAWLLGALEQEESDRVAAHVEGCDECPAELARLRPVVASIGLASPAVAVPAGLRERILERARHGPNGAPEVKPQKVVPIVRKPAPRRATFRLPISAVAAMLAVAVLAGGVAGAIGGRLTEGQPAAPVSQFSLTGHDAMSSSSAQVIELRTEGVTFVTFSHLPSLPDNKVYEIWLIKEGSQPVDAAVFVPDSDGSKTVLLSRLVTGYSTMAVTAEAAPDGGPAPTQQPQLFGSLG